MFNSIFGNSEPKEAVKKKQKPKFAWGYASDEFPKQKKLLFRVYEDDFGRDMWCNPDIDGSPFSKFIGNRSSVDRLSDAAYSALGKNDHRCSEIAWALFGPASTGKTTLAKIFAKSLGLPFVEISSSACKNTDYVLQQINDVLVRKHGFPLVFMNREGHFELPPMVLFFDEVHDLPNAVVQGLLKATEYDDGILTTPQGYTANCSHVTWMIGTTDAGDLFDAFVTRFTGKLNLSLYDYDEIAKIVQLNNNDWKYDLCKLVAKYSDHVPRTALAFAREMRLVRERDCESGWEEIANKVAERNDIDKYGMSKKRLSVLIALINGPMSMKNLGYQNGVGCKEREISKFLLPPMLSSRMVGVGSRGVTILDAGIAELEKRGITVLLGA